MISSKVETVKCELCGKDFLRWKKSSLNKRKPRTIIARAIGTLTCSKQCSNDFKIKKERLKWKNKLKKNL